MQPASLALAFTAGYLTKALLQTMGCFESKPAVPAATTAKQAPVPVPTPAPAPAQTSTVVPAAEKTLDVQRASVTVSEKDRAMLKLRNLRDELSRAIMRSEAVLKEEGRLAVQMRRQGNDASARVLMHKRQSVRQKIERSEMLVNTVQDLIATMDQAEDNRKMVQSIERGTAAIEDLQKGMSVDRVRNVMDDHNQAIAYTKEVGDLMGMDAELMSDETFEEAMQELEMEEGISEEGIGAVDQIPQVPSDMPGMPTEAVHVGAGEKPAVMEAA